MATSVLGIHAHPDDEALFTGGLLARQHALGAWTGVICCTDGRWGYSPGHIEVGTEGHDPAATAVQRKGDLRDSVAALGVDHLVTLDYYDSGMRGWEVNSWPEAFVQQPLEAVAQQLAKEIDLYRPGVVVTYDRHGVYGHPDHIKAHEATVRAVELSSSQPELLFVTVARSAVAAISASLGDGGDLPQWVTDMGEFGSTDEEICLLLDVREFAATKRSAIAAHSSQLDNHFFLGMDDEQFTAMLGAEVYTKGYATGAPLATEI